MGPASLGAVYCVPDGLAENRASAVKSIAGDTPGGRQPDVADAILALLLSRVASLGPGGARGSRPQPPHVPQAVTFVGGPGRADATVAQPAGDSSSGNDSRRVARSTFDLEDDADGRKN